MRDEIIDLFEKGIFSYKGNVFKIKEKEESEEESKENKFFKYIENESKSINYGLFEKHFSSIAPTVLAKKLYDTKNKDKNNELVNVIKCRLCYLKKEITNMSEEENKIEKPDKILKIVREILDFNKKNQNHLGDGFKILTSDQMLNRLPITLA